MSLGGDRRKRAREKLSEQAARPRFVACRVVVTVHARADRRVDPCTCCGSLVAEIVDQWTAADVLIDTVGRRRWTRDKHGHTEAFVEAWNSATQRTVYASIPAYADKHGTHARELLADTESKVLLSTGGNRSGKTELGVSLTLLRWAQWGGVPEDRFRILAPTLAQSHIVARKMVERLPREIVDHVPEHERSVDQSIQLADGTEIQLRHAGRPGTLKGDRIKWTHWTEAAVTEDPEAWIVTIGRTADCAGQVFLDTTPADQKHWIKRAIIDKIDAAASGVPTDLTARHYVMASMSNPWVLAKDMAAAREAAFAVDPSLAARDFDGEWSVPGSLLWCDLLQPHRHIVDVPDGGHIEPLGLFDRTSDVARAVSKSAAHAPWILAVDVNFRPCRVLACKIFAREEDAGLESYGVIVCDVMRYDALDAFAVAREVAARWDGRYRNALVIMDANSCHSGKHPSVHVAGRASSPKVEWERHGFTVIPPTLTAERKPCNPSLRDSTALVRKFLATEQPRTLLDRNGAPTLWEALSAQEDAGDGTPVKKAGTYSDREHCSQTDPLRYIHWCVFGSREYGKLQERAARLARGGSGSRLW